MKSKYLFIADSDVSESLRVHYVMVGITKRDQLKSERIKSYAETDTNVYFHKWDCQQCEFVERLAEQVYPNMSPRDAWHKFNLRNTRNSTLSELEAIITSDMNNQLTYPSNV